MRAICGGLIVMGIALPIAAAQTAMQQIGGKVVSARDGRPVAHADLALDEEKSHTTVATAISGDDGSFRFEAVPPGRYQLSGRAPGYLRASYLQHEGFYSGIVTGVGLETGALVLQLMAGSSIYGRLADETGEPVQQGRVALYREDPDARTERVRRVRTNIADEDGEFEFDGLAPGRYFVSASANPWYAVHPMPDGGNAFFPYRSAIDPALDVAYPTVFYPNALSSDEASPINLEGGEQARADMRMVPEHALTITVQRPAGEAFNGRTVQLMTRVFGAEEPMPVQMTLMNGLQTLVGVAPGQYKLDEFAPASNLLIRSQEVDLNSGPVSLNTAPPIALANLKVSVQPAPGEALPAQLSLGLQSSNSNRMFPSQVSSQGSVEFHGIPPGEYRVTAFGMGPVARIGTVAVDGHASSGRTVNVKGAGDVSAVVTLAGERSKVQGFARQDDGKPVAGAMIVLVPAGGDEDLFRRDESNLDGSFALNDVAPGKYIAIAIDGGWSLRWNDPATLMPYLLHGIPIAVPATGSAEIRLHEPVAAQSR